MMDENFDDYNNENINELVDKFEERLKFNQSFFFDVEEYEMLIDYYVENDNLSQTNFILKHAISQHPNSVSILLKKAQVYVYADKPNKALELLTQLEKIEPDNSDVFFVKGNIYSQLQRSEKAIEEYHKAIAKSEAIDEVYLNIAFEYEHLNNFLKSIEYFKKALEIDTENDVILFELSYCYEQSGLLEEGVGYITEYIDKFPYSKIAWTVLGNIYSAGNNVEKAVEAFDFAIAIDEADSGPYYHKASVYYTNSEYQKAIDVYKEILDLKLEYFMATPYFYIGECYEKLEEYETAIEFYTESIKIDENNPDAWIGRGICFYELKKILQGINDVKKGISLGDLESISDYKLILAEMLFKENMEGALELYQEVTMEAPENSDAWLDYSDALRDRGKLNEAIDVLMHATITYPDKLEFIYRLAALFLINKQVKDAFDTLLTAIDLDKSKSYISEFYGYIDELELDEYFIEVLSQFKSDIDKQINNQE
jgi:tetratricopeptide (TPR) repeat protein